MTDASAAFQRAGGFLGLMRRAGQIILGAEACLNAVRNGKARALLLDEGASDNARKRFTDACRSHGVPLYTCPEGALSAFLGKPGRMTAALMPGDMADKMLQLLAPPGDTSDTIPFSHDNRNNCGGASVE